MKIYATDLDDLALVLYSSRPAEEGPLSTDTHC